MDTSWSDSFTVTVKPGDEANSVSHPSSNHYCDEKRGKEGSFYDCLNKLSCIVLKINRAHWNILQMKDSTMCLNKDLGTVSVSNSNKTVFGPFAVK